MTKKKIKSSEDADQVVRIKAKDDTIKTKLPKEETQSTKIKDKAEKKEVSKKRKNPLSSIITYFKGAWSELKQVHWPNRKETWKMTGAMLAFTGVFVVIILLLDALFKYIFNLIIG